jgi:putative membrane protein
VAAGTHQARAGGQLLADGTVRVAQGSGQLEQGVKSLETGSRQLTEGVRQATEAIRAMRARMPPETELARLRGGASELADGQRELAAVLVRLEEGARLLRDGATTFGEEAALVPFAGKALADGTVRLRDGAGQLHDGLEAAAQGGMRLEVGAGTLAAGVGTLVQGTTALGTALARLDAALPPQRTLDVFSSGQATAAQGAAELAGATQRLQVGGKELRAGLEQLDAAAAQVRDGLLALRASLPPPTSTPNGTPAGLSSTVRAQLEYSARVPNQATAMAPNFAPLALWVGATLCAVLFAYQKLPAPLAGQPTLGIVLGKLAVPAVVVAGQAVLLAVLLQVVMKIEVVSSLRFVATLVLTALTFLAVLFMLVRVFGSAGKLIAVILLVTQLGASGSTLPIELATPFFQALHPYLPMSWSVRAIRISMFGAYAGAWVQSIATLGAMLVTAVAVAIVAGRWKVVEPEDYQPLLD